MSNDDAARGAFSGLPRPFGGTEEERAKGLAFALLAATGFLAVVAATNALLASAAHWPVSAGLAVVGVGLFAVGVMVVRGRFPWLVRGFRDLV